MLKPSEYSKSAVEAWVQHDRAGLCLAKFAERISNEPSDWGRQKIQQEIAYDIYARNGYKFGNDRADWYAAEYAAQEATYMHIERKIKEFAEQSGLSYGAMSGALRVALTGSSVLIEPIYVTLAKLTPAQVNGMIGVVVAVFLPETTKQDPDVKDYKDNGVPAVLPQITEEDDTDYDYVGHELCAPDIGMCRPDDSVLLPHEQHLSEEDIETLTAQLGEPNGVPKQPVVEVVKVEVQEPEELKNKTSMSKEPGQNRGSFSWGYNKIGGYHV